MAILRNFRIGDNPTGTRKTLSTSRLNEGFVLYWTDLQWS